MVIIEEAPLSFILLQIYLSNRMAFVFMRANDCGFNSQLL